MESMGWDVESKERTDREPRTHMIVASYPGVPIWRRGEEEHLIHTVVCMRFISKKSQKEDILVIFCVTVT